MGGKNRFLRRERMLKKITVIKVFSHRKIQQFVLTKLYDFEKFPLFLWLI